MTADIIKPISVTRLELPIKIPTVQSDTGRRIIFVMTDLDIPDGGTAQIYAKKPSGAEIYNNCTVGNLPTGASTVTVQLTSAMLEEAGDFMAQIQVVSGNDVVTSFVFTISNAKNLVNDSAAEGSNEYNALVEATQEALDAAQEALDAAAQVGDISSKTVTFQQAAQRANIQNGDTLAVAFGKLARYCADLKEAAYQDTANNLTTTEEGKVLDARQGKELKDQIGDLNELETSEKENLVGAVNELNTKTTLKIVDKSIAFNGGSFNLHLSRDGSIVTASTSGVINIPEANTIYTFGQVIPEGFRPLVSCGTAVALVSGQTQSGIMRLMVDENGTMSGVSSVNQNREIYGSISWDTGDPYPS